MKRSKKSSPKKYTGIAKVKERGQFRCVKYRVNYTDKFLEFLQKNFEDVAWINFYYNRGVSYQDRFTTWTKNKGWIN